ncbi:App1 family protein [Candidatus Uabimicrobium sp. HlEnr_7]|uniref:phosphatidate phosphatase App1 family protein n=1 Tax=Candidatus Uabimicrobium helgolandensis TaxID=3095367 RepID=UPI00355804CB
MKYIRYSIIATLLLGFSFLFVSGYVKKDETVTFFPTYGYYKDEKLVVDIHGWIYELEDSSIFRNMFIKTIQLSDKEMRNNPLFKKRMRYFLVDNERGKKITIHVGGGSLTLPKSKANGHFSLSMKWNKEQMQKHIKSGILPYQLPERKGDDRKFYGEIHIIEQEGISVISDIDDTIKISNVLNKKELVRNTLLRPFKEVPHMPEIYQKWKSQGARFHYVSGSPWQLYPELRNFFIAKNYPLGSFHLKKFRIKDSSIIKFLKSNQFKYKAAIIENIIDKFPKRKYILVGDTGEMDAVVYAHIAKKYKEQIIAICIRDVGKTGDSLANYENIFSEVKAKWILFTDAKDLENIELK